MVAHALIKAEPNEPFTCGQSTAHTGRTGEGAYTTTGRRLYTLKLIGGDGHDARKQKNIHIAYFSFACGANCYSKQKKSGRTTTYDMYGKI